MSFGARLKEELARRRHSSVILFCLVVLLVLLAAALMPRTWSAVVRLEIHTSADAGSGLARRIEQHLRAAPLEVGDHVETEWVGNTLSLRLRSTTPDRALEQASLLVSRIARAERELRRQSFLDLSSRLERDSELASVALSEAAARLEAHRLAMLEDGGAALAARITELSSQTDAHALTLRARADAKALLVRERTALEHRVAALQPELDAPSPVESRIAALRSELAEVRSKDDPASQEEVERQLSSLEVERQALAERRARAGQVLSDEILPAMEAARARIDSLGSEMEAIESDRQRALSMLDALRSEMDNLQRGNQPLQDLERRFADAKAEDLRIREELQRVRDDSVASAIVNEQLFTLRGRSTLPVRPDGWSAWTVSALALAVAACLVLGYLLWVMLSAGVRPNQLSGMPGTGPHSTVDSSPRLHPPVRPSAVVAAILCVVTVSAMGFFVVVAG